MSWITRVLHSNHCHKRLKPTYTISLCSRAVSEATRIDKFCHAGLAENAACGVADTSNLHRADLRGGSWALAGSTNRHKQRRRDQTDRSEKQQVSKFQIPQGPAICTEDHRRSGG